MLTELEPIDFPKTTSLFKGFGYSLSLPAMFAGNNPGRIFVDAPHKPRLGFAMTVEGNFLTGDPDDAESVETASRFLQEKVFTGEICLDDNTNLSLAVDPIQWEDQLPKMLPAHDVEKLHRYHYICQHLVFDWRAHIQPKFHVQAFDRALLADTSLEIPDSILDWASIEIRWGSRENHFQHGVSRVVLHQNKVVTISQSDCFANDQLDIGIYTLPEYRHQGLATIAAAACVETAFSRGFQKVGWHCNADNIGSWKTAEKVGFKRQKDYAYYFYIFDEVDHQAELGWFYFKQGAYQKTVKYYERVFAARKDHPDYYYHLAAVAWAALKDGNKAIHYLQAAVDHGWTARDWTEREEKFKLLHGSSQWDAILNQMSQ